MFTKNHSRKSFQPVVVRIIRIRRPLFDFLFHCHCTCLSHHHLLYCCSLITLFLCHSCTPVVYYSQSRVFPLDLRIICRLYPVRIICSLHFFLSHLPFRALFLQHTGHFPSCLRAFMLAYSLPFWLSFSLCVRF